MTIDLVALVARVRAFPIERLATYVAAALLAAVVLIALSAVGTVTARYLAAEPARPMELQ